MTNVIRSLQHMAAQGVTSNQLPTLSGQVLQKLSFIVVYTFKLLLRRLNNNLIKKPQ